jgi:hypothetical protein
VEDTDEEPDVDDIEVNAEVRTTSFYVHNHLQLNRKSSIMCICSVYAESLDRFGKLKISHLGIDSCL